MSTAHVLPVRLYLGVFAALLVLTAVTTGVAFVDLGPLSTPVAITIAAVKSLLVVLYFMHVKFESRLTWIVALAGLFWLALLIGLTLSDYLTRVLPDLVWG